MIILFGTVPQGLSCNVDNFQTVRCTVGVVTQQQSSNS